MPRIKKHKIHIKKEKGASSSSLIVFLRRFYKPVAAVISIIVFFAVYNTYIVDHSMLDIQFALEQTAKAQTIDDLQGLDMILGTQVLKEVAGKKIDSENIINLDFAATIAKKAEILSQAKDANFMLSALLEKKKKQRNGLLVALDGVNEKVIKTSDNIRDIFAKTAIRELVVVEADEKAFIGAKEFEKNNDLENAIKAYEEVLKQVPQYEGMEKVHLGFLYQRIGNLAKAKIIYEDIIKKSPGTEAAGFSRRLLDGLQDLKETARKKIILEEKIQKELSADKLQDLYYQLGATEALLGNFEGSEQAYKKAMEIDPKTDIGQKAAFNLGFNYKEQSKHTDSEKIFKQLGEQFPSSELAADANYWTADSLYNQGKYTEAVDKFKDVASRFKDMPIASVATFREGYACLYDLKDPKAAMAIFERLKEKFGQSSIAQHVTKEIVSDIGAVYRDAAFKLMLEGKIEEAIIKFDEALKLNSNDARSYAGLGAAKGLVQQWQEAIEKVTKGIELAPQDSYITASLGSVYILQNNMPAALELYEKIVKVDPKYAEAQYNLGWFYQREGRFDKAIEAYKNAIRYSPKLAVAHNNLGVCYWDLDRLDNAFAEFTQAVQLDKEFAKARYNLGLVHLLRGRLKQAQAEILKTLELTKEISGAQKVLDIIRQKMQESGQ